VLLKLMADPKDPIWIDPRRVSRVEIGDYKEHWWSKVLYTVDVCMDCYPWTAILGDYETESAAIIAADSFVQRITDSSR
jgi:hypothetical protein